MANLRGKLTYANVMATLAVFLVLGGGACAATALPANSVGTAQIRADAVTGGKIQDGSVTGRDLAAQLLDTEAGGGEPDAYYAKNPGDITIHGGESILASLTPPPGEYLVMSTVTLYGQALPPRAGETVNCWVGYKDLPYHPLSPMNTLITEDLEPTATATGILRLPNGRFDSIATVCRADSPGFAFGVRGGNATLTAIRLGAVHDQTPASTE
jgi:hypothetical protein